VSVTAKRCPRCEAALEPVAAVAPAPAHAPELALVGASASVSSATTTDPIVRSVVAQVALPKLPQPFATDPAELAVFLGVPVRAPEPSARPEARAADEPAAQLSPATLAAIADAAAEIAAAAEPTVHDTDAALDRVIARANEIAEHAIQPAPAAEPDPEPAPEPETPADREAPADRDEPPAPPRVLPVPAPAAAPVTEIVATPLAAPVVIARPETAPKPRRRKWFSRRDAFTRRFSRRERVMARTCVWLVVVLAFSVLALRLPVGARPELGATTVDTGGQIGSAETPVTSPFADAIRIQTKADLRVVVATAGQLHAFWKTYAPATPAVLGHELPQFAFVRGAQASVRVGQMSVAATKTRIVFAEYAGPKGCAYGRVVANQDAQVVIGSTAAACRATTPPAKGWSALGAG
jgi:hypothetical protein